MWICSYSCSSLTSSCRCVCLACVQKIPHSGFIPVFPGSAVRSNRRFCSFLVRSRLSMSWAATDRTWTSTRLKSSKQPHALARVSPVCRTNKINLADTCWRIGQYSLKVIRYPDLSLLFIVLINIIRCKSALIFIGKLNEDIIRYAIKCITYAQSLQI